MTEQQRLEGIARKVTDTVSCMANPEAVGQLIFFGLQEAVDGAECEKCREKDEVLRRCADEFGLNENCDCCGDDIPDCMCPCHPVREALATESRPTKERG